MYSIAVTEHSLYDLIPLNLLMCVLQLRAMVVNLWHMYQGGCLSMSVSTVNFISFVEYHIHKEVLQAHFNWVLKLMKELWSQTSTSNGGHPYYCWVLLAITGRSPVESFMQLCTAVSETRIPWDMCLGLSLSIRTVCISAPDLGV